MRRIPTQNNTFLDILRLPEAIDIILCSVKVNYHIIHNIVDQN